jgi:hypothetical protein
MDPAIPLDSIEIYDADYGTNKNSSMEGEPRDYKETKNVGTNFPYIEINNYVFNQDEILNFSIDYTGFLPKVSFKVFVKGKTFPSGAIPKDGDLASVFIRALNDTFKPIRNDYRITSVTSKGADSEGMYGAYTINGELFVPHLYDEVVVSYKGTSYNVLKEIARELKLGFASNDTATADEQTWISPRTDYREYILSIADHAWKDEQSFFDVFIDVYYNLNFVNINNQFSEDTNVDLALLTNLRITDTMGGETTEKQLTELTGQTSKILTNWPDYKGTPGFIHRYNVSNKSNQVSQAYGYKTYTQFFEQNSEQYWSIYVDPLNTEGAGGNKIILKGRTTKPGTPSEDYWKTQARHVWMGIQYTAPEGNAHEKYNYAKLWNDRNNVELEKITINIDLERGNFNLYRGERIPLILFVMNDIRHQTILNSPEQEQPDAMYPSMILDRFYSGYYMIAGMSFSYSQDSPISSMGMPTEENPRNPPGFIHKVYLTRREWPTPV